FGRPGSVSSAELAGLVRDVSQPYLLLLGTGWGLADEIFSRADFVLAPIKGQGDYNHLSVRSAAAILLDRLLGDR
ncbi:MAG TPA: RNA methyltransferase, partial [Geobacteraceae bacterium]|nr:RNA methyltransferase [Geobacteraceae bacterium]